MMVSMDDLPIYSDHYPLFSLLAEDKETSAFKLADYQFRNAVDEIKRRRESENENGS